LPILYRGREQRFGVVPEVRASSRLGWIRHIPSGLPIAVLLPD
jgi:hypothetical protein